MIKLNIDILCHFIIFHFTACKIKMSQIFILYHSTKTHKVIVKCNSYFTMSFYKLSKMSVK